MVGQYLRIRRVSKPENDDSKGQSYGLSELDDIDCELEIPDNECVIAVRKISTRLKGNISGDTNEFISGITSQLATKFPTESQKISDELTAKFRADSETEKEFSKKTQDE